MKGIESIYVKLLRSLALVLSALLLWAVPVHADQVYSAGDMQGLYGGAWVSTPYGFTYYEPVQGFLDGRGTQDAQISDAVYYRCDKSRGLWVNIYRGRQDYGATIDDIERHVSGYASDVQRVSCNGLQVIDFDAYGNTRNVAFPDRSGNIVQLTVMSLDGSNVDLSVYALQLFSSLQPIQHQSGTTLYVTEASYADPSGAGTSDDSGYDDYDDYDDPQEEMISGLIDQSYEQVGQVVSGSESYSEPDPAYLYAIRRLLSMYGISGGSSPSLDFYAEDSSQNSHAAGGLAFASLQGRNGSGYAYLVAAVHNRQIEEQLFATFLLYIYSFEDGKLVLIDCRPSMDFEILDYQGTLALYSGCGDGTMEQLLLFGPEYSTREFEGDLENPIDPEDNALVRELRSLSPILTFPSADQNAYTYSEDGQSYMSSELESTVEKLSGGQSSLNGSTEE